MFQVVYSPYYIQLLLLMCLLNVNQLALAHTLGLSVQEHVVKMDKIPKGLSKTDWNSVKTQIKAGKYQAYSNSQGGYQTSNPAQGWKIDFGKNGTTTLRARDRNSPAYYLSLTLNAYGYKTLQPLHDPQRVSHQKNKVSYHWNDVLTEWWINSETDLEQWFSLNHRPAGASSGGLLSLKMTVDSSLKTNQQGNGIQFRDLMGTTITYNKLKVWDATGRELPAQMELADNNLLLRIDDRTADYPLTIDPSFQQQAYLKASNSEAEDKFGESVAISGDTLVVGAFAESSNAIGVNGDQSDNSAVQSGAAYVFIRTGNSWSQQAYLKASNTEELDQFGRAVAISGDTIVIGATGDASEAVGVDGDQNDNSAFFSGAAYIFTRNNDVWSQQAYLKASNTQAADQFGESVAISGDTVLISASGEDSNARGVNGNQNNNTALSSGAAYVFTRSDDIWSQQAYLKSSNSEAFDLFGNSFLGGRSVAISGNTAVVGAYGEDSSAVGVNSNQNNNSEEGSGAAYVYIRNGDTWSQQAYLKASNTQKNDSFGNAVSLFGDTVVIGALFESSDALGVNGDESNDLAAFSGAAYVFTRNENNWSQQAYLKASNTNEGDTFGRSVALSNDLLVVGASTEASNATGIDGDQDDNSNVTAGAAYVFTNRGGSWSQKAYLKASNTEAMSSGTEDESGLFGFSVAISGNTLVVGALGESSDANGVDGDQNDNSAIRAGAAYTFVVSDVSLDIDGDGQASPLTDGLLMIRYFFGFRGNILIDSVVGSSAIRTGATEIESYIQTGIDSNRWDIDGDGSVKPLTDGLLIIRYLFGFTGNTLIANAIDTNATRITANDVESYLDAI